MNIFLGNILKKNKWLSSDKFWMLLCLSIFILITFPNMITHYPWADESVAWSVARKIDFSNILFITRTQGHPVLWYLFLMPFSKTDFFYPYPMLILNYIFCLSALVIMWLYGSFNRYFKVIITFSYIFLSYYSIYARNYAVGILGLFLLLAMYKKQLEKPLLYSVLIVLIAHTNIFAAIPASALGLVFISKMIKDKICAKKMIFSLLIILSGIIFWCLPYMFIKIIGFKPINPTSIRIFFTEDILSVYLLIAYLTSFLLLCKNKLSAFYLIYTTFFTLLVFKFLHPGFFHHYIFLFINLIIGLWLYSLKNNKIHLLFYVCFALIFLPPLNYKCGYLRPVNKTVVAEYIKENYLNWAEQGIFKIYIESWFDFHEIINYIQKCNKSITVQRIRQYEFEDNCIIFSYYSNLPYKKINKIKLSDGSNVFVYERKIHP